MNCSDTPVLESGGLQRLPVILRAPSREDGVRIWDLIAECPPLDQNSLYCNLLQCTDFADFCVVAEKSDEIVGWISAYRPPNDSDTLFIWQVAVHENVRGTGLARAMIEHLLSRPAVHGVTKVKSTITPGNSPSWALFESLAKRLSTPLNSAGWFDKDRQFGGRHDTEHLVTIGPFEAIGAR